MFDNPRLLPRGFLILGADRLKLDQPLRRGKHVHYIGQNSLNRIGNVGRDELRAALDFIAVWLAHVAVKQVAPNIGRAPLLGVLDQAPNIRLQTVFHVRSY